MILDDYERFRTLIADVHGFYGKDVSSFALTVWWEAMKPFDMDAVAQAMNRHVMNPDSGQFMPKPADIVKMLQGSTQDSALRAWAKVDKAVRHVGTWDDVAFDDPIIHRVLHDMGGWIAMGHKTEDEWPFVAKEFENRYRAFKTRNERPEYPPVLIGLAGANNRMQGQKVAPPTLIGDKETAKLVIQGGADKPLLQFSKDNHIESAVLRIVDKSEVAA
ncbi:MAG TPA: DUF6475 domain-containing protein [Sideroxyarcus sp.]|nr:DUF6475 domain-containing protein [Sideroxyarcus sp.]